MDSLTARILRYQRTGREREQILEELSRKIIAFPRRHHRWDDETCADFLSHMYPRVESMIERFTHHGVPFEGYLSTVLTHQSKSFAERRRRERMRWHLSEDDTMWDSEQTGQSVECPDDPAPDPGALDVFGIGPAGRVTSEGGRRKLLVAALKHYSRLPDGGIRTLARLTGERESRLHGFVAELHEGLESQRRRLSEYRSRRNQAFSRLNLLERQLRDEIDEAVKQRLRDRCEKLRVTMRRNQDILGRIRAVPTNREVARVLGIPKGSVDSILHRLKLRAASLYPLDHEKRA